MCSTSSSWPLHRSTQIIHKTEFIISCRRLSSDFELGVRLLAQIEFARSHPMEHPVGSKSGSERVPKWKAPTVGLWSWVTFRQLGRWKRQRPHSSHHH